jgi:hypothetical protein
MNDQNSDSGIGRSSKEGAEFTSGNLLESDETPAPQWSYCLHLLPTRQNLTPVAKAKRDLEISSIYST